MDKKYNIAKAINILVCMGIVVAIMLCAYNAWSLNGEQEFLDDFKEAQEELEFGRAKKLLADFKIEYGSITKKNKSCTSTDMVDEGFIQGYTSNEASLWWHPMGRRVFFVRGEGAFELTDKVEENA